MTPKKLSRTCKWGSIDLGGGNADDGVGGWGVEEKNEAADGSRNDNGMVVGHP